MTTARLVSSATAAASLIAATAPCQLAGFSGYNAKASAQFIQIHDATTLLADTAVPIVSITVPATSNFSWAPVQPIQMSKGIVICNSSTVATKTIGSADTSFYVEVA